MTHLSYLKFPDLKVGVTGSFDSWIALIIRLQGRYLSFMSKYCEYGTFAEMIKI